MFLSTHTLILSTLCLLLFDLTSNRATVGASEASTYFLGLHKIYTSHGILKPAFQPQIEKYSIILPRACSNIDITPEIDYSRPEYEMGRLAPLLTISWKSSTSLEQHNTQRHVELPENGKPLSVYVKVANPKNSLDFKVYTLTIIQSKTYPLVGLKNLEILDDQKNYPFLSQNISLDTYLYDIFVKPGISHFKLKPRCVLGNTATVNGNLISGESWISISREADHYRQIVEILCSSNQAHKKYIFSVITNRQSSEIPNPLVAMTSTGFMCTYHETYYDCPNPKSKNYKAQLIIGGPLDVRYTVESSDKSVQLRAFSDTQTIPFEYTTVGKIKLVAQAGANTISWDINFVGARLQGVLRICGLTLGSILVLLLTSLIFVIGFSNFHGIGTPIGIPEAATTLVLIVQFVCFVTSIKGIEYKFLAEIADSIKWVTLFWPPPGSIHFSSMPSWGDPNDIRNAYGCLFWTSLLHVVTSLIHGILLLGVKGSEITYTIPHNMRFGNWEQRLLHSTCFPMCVAASMILFNSNTTLNWKLYSSFILIFFPTWLCFVCKTMYEHIKYDKVLWVWSKPYERVPTGDDPTGYWSDCYCDQLVTQPVNRSLTKDIYPFQWTSTVADVRTHILQKDSTYIPEFSLEDFFFARLEQEDYTHDESSESYGTVAFTTEVLRTVRPKRICRGQRLIAGLLDSRWLDMLMTYEALIQCYEGIVKNPHFGDSVIRLFIKTFQLTGPCTNGAFCFFYDGARLPCIRIVDAMYRFILGALIGVALVNVEKTNVGMLIWILIAVISKLYVLYQFFFKAYTRPAENWALRILIAGILFLSIIPILSKLQQTDVAGPNFLIYLLLGLSCCSIFYLTVYGAAVLILTCSAILCPSLEETRFLEEMANCNVIIAQVSDNESWAVDVPGYCSDPIRDLKVQCTVVDNEQLQVSIFPSGEEPTLQLSVFDILRVNTVYDRLLKQPVLSLFVPDSSAAIGYRHINIYDAEIVFGEVCRFLEDDPVLEPVAESIARNISLQLNTTHRASAAITSMTIIFPGKKSYKKDDYTNYD